MDTSVADPLVGRTFDWRYRIDARVARGGMATVYSALDIRLDRRVAVKVMHPALADDEAFVARFIREAKSAARLSHPNAVSVYDQGEDVHTGRVFLVMEYVEGRTLRDLLHERGRLTPAEAAAVFEPVLAALDAAHRAGIVHRDIKPENVLLADDGRVKVADFGLARAVEVSPLTATTGLLIGTVAYLAPEQVERGDAGTRSDVYSAGILLFEMLTGVTPYAGDSPLSVAFRHVHDDVPPPSDRVPEVPPSLDALVLRATRRDPDARPADAGAFLAELRQVRRLVGPAPIPRAASPTFSSAADGVTITLPRPEPPTRHTRVLTLPEPPSRAPDPARTVDPPVRRRRTGLLVGLLVLALTLAAVGVGTYFGSRYTGAPSVLGLDRQQAEAAAQTAGLSLRVADPGDFSEDVAAGLVLGQDPGPNDRVAEDGTLVVTLSRGPERFPVPKVVGLEVAAARTALATASLRPGDVTPRADDRVPAGRVLASSPASGAALRRGDPVELTVSTGPPPVALPDFTGKPAAASVAALKKAGFAVTVTERFDDDVARGIVAGQEPAGGTRPKGSAVALTVSKGPDLVKVPDVVDLDRDVARSRLRALGFDVRVIPVLPAGPDRVLRSTPGPGNLARRGSTVTLYVF